MSKDQDLAEDLDFDCLKTYSVTLQIYFINKTHLDIDHRLSL